jgi:hypothetical protein
VSRCASSRPLHCLPPSSRLWKFLYCIALTLEPCLQPSCFPFLAYLFSTTNFRLLRVQPAHLRPSVLDLLLLLDCLAEVVAARETELLKLEIADEAVEVGLGDKAATASATRGTRDGVGGALAPSMLMEAIRRQRTRVVLSFVALFPFTCNTRRGS